MNRPEQYSDLHTNKAKLALIQRTLNKEKGQVIHMSKYTTDNACIRFKL